MPSTPPPGQPAPPSGELPPTALAHANQRRFGVYLHVPFCATRCGYCDFNTYTPGELGGSADPSSWLDAVLAEARLAALVLGHDRPISTVFVGGGTPTLVPAAMVSRVLKELDGEFGFATGAEVTIEANPESATPEGLAELVGAGVNRISFGMQSAAPHVLRTLDRRHTPGRVAEAVALARAAGIASLSLDLIYGTPGESDEDWLHSLESALALRPDHVSAYALVVEDGTQLARRVRRGEVLPVDDDVLADRYEQADELLTAAGFDWYEVSNWARGTEHRCQHNLGYWRGDDWWGLGPGAHSHVGGVRWWNVRHPAAYAARCAAGESPAQAREVLDAEAQQLERVLLGVRLADGLPLTALDPPGRRAAVQLAADGLLQRGPLDGGRVALTRRGRLLADAVVRTLTE